jgi:hypothetical protein
MPTYEISLDNGTTLHIDAVDQNSALSGAQHFLAQSQPDIQNSNQSNAPQSVYTIQTPSGHQLDIQAPDQETALRGAREWHAAQQQQPNTLTDVAKQLASGVAETPENLLATPARISNLAQRGINWAVHQVAPDSAMDKAGQDVVSRDEALSNSIYNALPAPSKYLPQPETTAGQYARTVGNMLPTAALGTGSVLMRLIGQGVIPGLASEAAGQATQGTEYETPARIAAALLTSRSGPKAALPTSEDVAAQASKNFDDFRSAPVTIKPDVVENAVKNAKNDLTAKGLSQSPAYSMGDQYLGNTTPVSLNQLQETRSILGKAANRTDTPEGYAALQVKNHIDNLFDSLQPSDTVVGANALPQALNDLKAGRQNTAVAHRLALLEGKQQAGADNAAVNVTHDDDLAVRKQLNSLLKNRASMRRLSAYEDDIRDAAHGNPLVKAASGLGHLLGGHNSFLVPILTGEAIGPGVGLGTAAAMYGTGIALRRFAARSTANKLGNLTNKIASNAVGLPKTTTVNPLLQRALAASLAARGGQQQ